jgi:hypothetical protein
MDEVTLERILYKRRLHLRQAMDRALLRDTTHDNDVFTTTLEMGGILMVQLQVDMDWLSFDLDALQTMVPQLLVPGAKVMGIISGGCDNCYLIFWTLEGVVGGQ